MNIPGVVIATTPRQAPKTSSRNNTRSAVRTNIKRTTQTTTNRTIINNPVRKSCVNIPQSLDYCGGCGKKFDSASDGCTCGSIFTPNIPPPTPGIRGVINNKRKNAIEKPQLKNFLGWGVSSGVEFKPDPRSPYEVRTVSYGGADVFVPPTIDIDTDKYVVVDSGVNNDGSNRYMVVKYEDRCKPIAVTDNIGTYKCIQLTDEGNLCIQTLDNKPKLVPPTPRGLVVPQCATPRINNRSLGVVLNVMS